jgi:hypothetical protein
VFFVKAQDVHLANVDPWFMWLPYRPELEAAIADEVSRAIDNSPTPEKAITIERPKPSSAKLPLR